MFTTVAIFSLILLSVNQVDGRKFHSRRTDPLSVLQNTCANTPNAGDCVRIKLQMEDLLRKCNDMVTQVSACGDVRSKYCYIWPAELFCYTSGGGGQVIVTTKAPSGTNDPNWYQIPSDPNELKLRGDYCVTHQSEDKCRNLLSALKVRYEECSKRPKTDASCQSFKISLCAAFPKFSPCLNGNGGLKRRTTRLQNLLRLRRQVRWNDID
ncbi:unnamed protein product [Adineta ricciae]|uniref:Secreted protein n=2 Tax=Adineta ricciae TaxID=249248 RepID=A0A814RJS8_ADIRI|nr:unnamed protein product [Adineta ricciae]